MNCPFCGGEMLSGALEAYVYRSSMQEKLQWVPPAAGSAQKADKPGVLEHMREALLQKPWDRSRAVPLEAHFGARDIKAVLVDGREYLEDAWYCPACEKAVCVFSKCRQVQPEPDELVTCPKCGTEHSKYITCPNCLAGEGMHQPRKGQTEQKKRAERKKDRDPWD